MKIWKDSFFRFSNLKCPQWIWRSRDRDYEYPTKKYPAQSRTFFKPSVEHINNKVCAQNYSDKKKILELQPSTNYITSTSPLIINYITNELQLTGVGLENMKKCVTTRDYSLKFLCIKIWRIFFRLCKLCKFLRDFILSTFMHEYNNSSLVIFYLNFRRSAPVLQYSD